MVHVAPITDINLTFLECLSRKQLQPSTDNINVFLDFVYFATYRWGSEQRAQSRNQQIFMKRKFYSWQETVRHNPSGRSCKVKTAVRAGKIADKCQLNDVQLRDKFVG